ncbi:hypothetical protein [Nonomuraea polychroma]|uniref:hypothetical protein n=1 Tax=Nonomuraea polychroma TaxID=46176 RepID=UPI000FDD1B1B|nr:hypothetical protein [Nonomuraea polychroma]
MRRSAGDDGQGLCGAADGLGLRCGGPHLLVREGIRAAARLHHRDGRRWLPLLAVALLLVCGPPMLRGPVLWRLAVLRGLAMLGGLPVLWRLPLLRGAAVLRGPVLRWLVVRRGLPVLRGLPRLRALAMLGRMSLVVLRPRVRRPAVWRRLLPRRRRPAVPRLWLLALPARVGWLPGVGRPVGRARLAGLRWLVGLGRLVRLAGRWGEPVAARVVPGHGLTSSSRPGRRRLRARW